MKILKKIIGYVGVILFLNLLVTWIFVSKNNGEKYVDEYINGAKQVKVHVKDEVFREQFNHKSFFKYSILFKGIYGNGQGYIFKDKVSGKYYNILRFDKYGEFRYAQTSKINGEDLYVQVDPVQYNDPSYGTLENPILVFSYKGVNKTFMTEVSTDEIGSDGRYINKEVSLAPSEEEYRYNVAQYLTYVMPKEEFKARFKE